MVKVIGRDKSEVKRITCRSCASILEYTSNEVQTYNWIDYSGGRNVSEWVHCPNCGAQVLIRNW